MSNDLEQRVQQYRTFELPGQPMATHMGTSYLINDLWKEVERLRAELDAARRTAEYWKAEHLAGNAELDALKRNNQYCPMCGSVPEKKTMTEQDFASAYAGMSLRDWFAGMAMQGLLAQSIGTAMGSDVIHGAKYAYEMADAMLAAAPTQPNAPAGYPHKWDGPGERCLKCGDKDWMGGLCSVSDDNTEVVPKPGDKA